MSDGDLAAEAARWLRYAEDDLAFGEEALRSGTAQPRHICWLSQQAAEKALKAALTANGVPFPRSHDLDALRALLPETSATKTKFPDLAELTEWAVETRYPGDSPEAVEGDAKRAIAEARFVVDSVRAELAPSRKPDR